MSEPTQESIALAKLSIGVHSIKKNANGAWVTVSITENGAGIFGIPVTQILEQPDLWVGRIHPNDIDSALAAFEEITESEEKNIFYRFRDARDTYKWIEFRFSLTDQGIIVGFASDGTKHRADEYFSRLNVAGRSSLVSLLESGDLNANINTFLSTLGSAMAIDRARLVRFRSDGRAFITHEWYRYDDSDSTQLPSQIPEGAVQWWKHKLGEEGGIAIESSDRADLPEDVANAIAECSVNAILAVPAVINGTVEAFACFEVMQGVRRWLPNEILEATIVLNGYARSIERRIEDRKQAAEEYKLRSSEERYRLITSHSPVVLFGIDAEGTFTLSEGLGLGSMGARAGDVVGRSMYELYRNYPEVLEHANHALAGEESHGRIKIGNRVFETWFTPVKDEDDVIVGVSGVSVDITRRHELEEQQLIMMRELDHRVKNNIASVMSLVNLSKHGADSVDAYAEALDGRLHALAVAHSTLAKSHWSGAWLRDILLLTLQPYMAGRRSQIQFNGPDVELKGILARPMCMVIHELATNAVKHGALKEESGKIVITTHILPNNTIELTWVESGGPNVSQEQTPSTGISLLEGLVNHELHGSLLMDFKESGLHCTIQVPLDEPQ
ncbi:MAG: HWE histidine kinase domain-containing protein [Phycisphaerales bacterium]|jgi:PAS domain S-box-containing protein|nr:HWE histidine kinase domain-containing protein [Phycisphaerales bacterium]